MSAERIPPGRDAPAALEGLAKQPLDEARQKLETLAGVPALERADWESRLAAFPRLSLAHYPTPLEPLHRLSEAVGRPVYVKRDDEIGPGLGGNKTRKLEYLLAEARQRGASRVVTFGGLQSNHARLTAAAARQCGLEAHLFYFERRPDHLPGNLLLNRILGAHLHFIPLGGGGGMSLEATIRLVRWVTAVYMLGRGLAPCYFIPVGGHTWRGCLGYVQAALELDAQAHRLGLADAWVVMAAGSGGTLAGMLAGLALCGSRLRPLGIDVGRLWKGFRLSIARLANETLERLGAPPRFTPQAVPLIEERYVGECYGRPSLQCVQAVNRLARLEGLLLDPVYTGKAFGGLLDWLEQQPPVPTRASPGELPVLGPDDPVIFLHTGGVPALFAFEDRQYRG